MELSEPPSESPETKSPDATSSSAAEDPTENNDMSFQYPGYLLISAVRALSDTEFNPSQMAVLQAGKNGCEITVYDHDIFLVLQLSATSFPLGDYQCRNPFRKMFSLSGLDVALLPHRIVQCYYVSVSVDEGSNILSFRWKARQGTYHSSPINIELHDVIPEQQKFPVISYGLEALIPIKHLVNVAFQVLMMRPAGNVPSEDVFDYIKRMKEVTTKIYDDPERVEQCEKDVDSIWKHWIYWGTLHKAAINADNCSVYLVIEPSDRVMLRLKLNDITHTGELVYLSPADFLSHTTVYELPCLDQFRSLF